MATTPTKQTTADLTLTPYVVLGELTDPGHCQAWMEAAARRCGRPTDGHLCTRHRTVASRRRATALAKRQAEDARRASANQARRAQARANVERNRRELFHISNRLKIITAAPTQDRAAVGGNVHPSIARRTEAAFSPARTAEVRRLNRRAETLRAELALAAQN